MSSFYADPAVGGDGTTTTDDNNASTGLGNGGFWTRLVPMFTNIVNIANNIKSYVATALNGGAITIRYTFDSTITDADPGAGKLRLSSATQNTSTVIRTDVLDSTSVDWTAILDTLDSSTSTVKGEIRLAKINDATKWLLFQLTARATPSGYRNFTVTCTGSSSANPFVNGDQLLMTYTRVGDKGNTGPQGNLVRRVSSIASSATPTPDSANYDMLVITALAANATIAAPTGSPVDGQSLMIRIKDNGTSRTLAYNAAYRAGTDVALPSATVVSKTMYLGFIYNASDSKWDFVSTVNNI